ncbi:MFS transporter [Pseudonocardia sp. TRM90224]|uniref:MFS transporter n=1 Tax=Pseudonocardia sp. TRM90224 TaxID=2812678 RepID=UPI001E5A0CE6|nr:MFS transporter [Pseudonocardia sp. TRM90224]
MNPAVKAAVKAPERGRRVRGPLAGLLVSTALSVTGNAVVAVAVPWVVLARTGSATAAGVAGAAAILPVALAALFGGALIDRLGRRFCAVGADVLSALAVAAMPLLDAAFGLEYWLILVLVALGAVFDGPGAAAREALRPDVAKAGAQPLPRVNAWGEAAESVGNMVGPGIGGLLLVALNGFGALWVTVVMFVLSAVITACTVPAHLSPLPVREPYLRSVKEGLVFLLKDPGLRAVALTATVIVAFIAPFGSVVLNAHLQEVGEPGQYGLILAVLAVGGLAGAIGYGLVGHRFTERPVLVGTVTLTAIGLAGFAFLPTVPVMLALAFVAGVVSGPVNPVVAVIMQERTPERLRGRVIGSYTSVAVAAGPLGLLALGPVVDAGGAAAGFAVIAAGCLLAAVYAACSRGLRRHPSVAPDQAKG